jgi:hypothetical protein
LDGCSYDVKNDGAEVAFSGMTSTEFNKKIPIGSEVDRR